MLSTFSVIVLCRVCVEPVRECVQNIPLYTQGPFRINTAAYKPSSFTHYSTQVLYSRFHSFFIQIQSVTQTIFHTIHTTYNYLLLQEKKLQVIRMGTI